VYVWRLKVAERLPDELTLLLLVESHLDVVLRDLDQTIELFSSRFHRIGKVALQCPIGELIVNNKLNNCFDNTTRGSVNELLRKALRGECKKLCFLQTVNYFTHPEISLWNFKTIRMKRQVSAT
jgi:hypothetical protein